MLSNLEVLDALCYCCVAVYNAPEEGVIKRYLDIMCFSDGVLYVTFVCSATSASLVRRCNTK